MRLLLDTHVLLWQLSGSRTLGPEATAAIEQASALYLSVVSYAELGIKAAAGKFRLAPGFEEAVRVSGVSVLPLEPAHGLEVAELPLHHRDPFDRLLIAQARRERLTLVSADPRFGAYDVQLVRPA